MNSYINPSEKIACVVSQSLSAFVPYSSIERTCIGICPIHFSFHRSHLYSLLCHIPLCTDFVSFCLLGAVCRFDIPVAESGSCEDRGEPRGQCTRGR